MGLLERYEDTSSPPSHRPVGCCGSQNTTGRQAIWNPVGFGPLCLCSSHCSLPSCKAVYKKSAFFGRFCGVRNASLRRTFCCVVHQKRDFKAHPAASTTLLVGSFQLSPPTLDSRLTALQLSTSTRSRLTKLAIRLPLVWTARPRVRLWP